ncbi:MAG: AAA domain-containing protein, partial [Candidatus Binatia bacterium]
MTQTRSGGLDETLEGSAAWWPGPPKGGADILSVIPETQQINLRFATASPPQNGKIRIYPPCYLEALHECWKNNVWAEQCLAWLETIQRDNTYDAGKVLDPEPFRWLRSRQAEAFKLPGWKASFLWGPPGTGKTTTLGAMLAQYVIQFPTARVLLLSTTNAAVDLALVAVDKALEKLAAHSSTAAKVRQRCVRIGNHFVASNYTGREHLLPVKDNTLIRRLAALEAQRPAIENVQAYAVWKQQVELVRQQIRAQAVGVLKKASLAAMTTTRAVFTFDNLCDLSPYDLLVFDEASQVGCAHALALAPLAQHALFAGDPKQLSPIVRSDHLLAKRWLGESMFSYMDESVDSTCLLNEQSRMAKPICDIISNVFYGGNLIVAADCKGDSKWREERNLVPTRRMGHKHVHLETIDSEGDWSSRYHGPIRHHSAKFIHDLGVELNRHMAQTDILVLTPFRAQRALIRSFLATAGYKQVTVSTVHRARGSERHT